ncbi:hypothetical protein CEXT_179951, partial [Caerostris extrusa]
MVPQEEHNFQVP